MASGDHDSFSRVLADAKQTVLTASSSISVAATRVPDPAGKVLSACDELGLKAATVAVLFSGQPPQPGEAKAVIQSLLHLVIALSDAFSHCLVGAIGVLKQALEKSFKAIGRAVLALMDGVAAVMARKAPPKRLAVLAEQVRSQAETAKAAPLDNRSALCNVIAAAGMSVQDVIREMNEVAVDHELNTDVNTLASRFSDMNVLSFADVDPQGHPHTTTPDGGGARQLKSHPSAPLGATSLPGTFSHSGGASDRAQALSRSQGAAAVSVGTATEPAGDEHSASDDDLEGGVLDSKGVRMLPHEQAQLQEGLWILHKAFHVIQAMMSHAMQADARDSDASAAWEAAAEHILRLQVASDELGAAMYPPQDEEQMRAATDAILKAADGIRIHSQRFEVDHEVTHACGEPFQ